MSDKYKIKIAVPWLGFLFAALVILKLMGKIACSWWWVWAPLWMPFALVLGIVGVVFLIALIAAFCGR